MGFKQIQVEHQLVLLILTLPGDFAFINQGTSEMKPCRSIITKLEEDNYQYKLNQ